MPTGMDTVQVRKDTAGATRHIRAILTLKDMLQSDHAGNGLNFAYKYYKDDNHGMVPLITEYDALHFLFKFYNYPPDFIATLFDTKSKIDVESALNAHYQDVSKQMGYTVLPPEDAINSYGYALMANMPDKAFALFSMNIKNYPNSFNVYDSMGDYYSSKGDKANTVLYYNKALKIMENPDTRGKLNKIMAAKNAAAPASL